MGTLNRNHQYLNHMLNKFKDDNININIDGYKPLIIKGTKNFHVQVSGNIKSMDIRFDCLGPGYYHGKFIPNTDREIKDMETYVGEALLKIHDNISGNM